MAEEIIKSAAISPCGTYRWSLIRQWCDARPYMAFVMLNPSTADHQVDDPTIRRCMWFARREDAGGIVVVNLFAYRTPSPKALKQAVAEGVDVVGDGNADRARELLSGCPHVVAAWGAHGELLGRDKEFLKQFAGELLCLGTTKNGSPRHPLYVRNDAPFKPFR